MRVEKNKGRAVIYQLLVRTFGNKNTTRKPWGTIEENGCGKFADIDSKALKAIRKMGFNYIWPTGVIEQASGTDYPGRPADPPDILKGKAGSPYAIRDYFDVCPDYALEPENRIAEFRDMVKRCRKAGLRVIIDFVPNHVARSYGSDVRPELSFGEGDDHGKFFERDNHFYYLNQSDAGGGPPLKLPTGGMPGCTGLFAPETAFGRVTGNNSITWSPSIHDWYETVKLNYGHDFTLGRTTQHLPGADAAVEDVPRTWATMDEILAYWQEMGVDGFRVDMAHIVPMEFWYWLVKRARARDAEVFFMAEAYDSDPAKLTDKDVLEDLVKAGFNGAYEHPTYKILQGIYEQGKWANDIDGETFSGSRFHQCVRYLENHDEVRIAHPNHWGGVGMEAGKPAAAVMFGMSGSALMLYSGQEVGEPASGEEGFSGDDGRSSIFDYTSMPEFQKWVNDGKFDGGGLSKNQKALRTWYEKLFKVLEEPAFTKGDFYGLNHANKENKCFGRVGDETVSGHWLYAFLRRDVESGQAFLCVANFSSQETLKDVRVIIPEHALGYLGIAAAKSVGLGCEFGGNGDLEAKTADILRDGVSIGDMEPFGVRYYVLK
ncbi:MAG: alpha-amylase family glycosyl hydrolase [Akkermansiaceae bacterium]|nr:alpha-amylase family glycosyl hydrolase [Akkermansiaceae bacterium]MDP4647723.1 alpha-amylase family glycosyl hydrolase [Akkermansiaceae bacterium]MDP4722216.1 alpha-amylase family glycosyl hydrolase [Akkermansiaceae bacterium]MDP4780257.1 alpha-amylase family glycosyl hydrolase [Akkermansiaceae bacterium]MDP4848626.1 alpha-amylase family glycosyl hydrolase [Akkermansiaceae bacterium]